MRFSCDTCQARYTIADEKVRGKLVRVRCKRCGSSILLRQTDDDAPETDLPDDDATHVVKVDDVRKSFGLTHRPEALGGHGRLVSRGTSESAQAAPRLGKGTAARSVEPDEKPEWHLIVAGQEVGPLSLEHLMERAEAGLLTPRSYVWRDGMPGWERLKNVPPLARALNLIPPPSHPGVPPPKPVDALDQAPVSMPSGRPVEEPARSEQAREFAGSSVERVARTAAEQRSKEEAHAREIAELRAQEEAHSRRAAEKRRAQEEAEAREAGEIRRRREEAQAKEAEKLRLREEAHAREVAELRAQEEARTRRAAEKRRAQEEAEALEAAEKRRVQEEAEALEAAEKRRVQEAAERRRIQEAAAAREAAEKLRAQEEAAEKRRVQEAAEAREAAEKRRAQEEAEAHEAARKRRAQEEAEAHEAAQKRRTQEAEEAREAAEKRGIKEAEAAEKRRAQEAADAREAAEKRRADDEARAREATDKLSAQAEAEAAERRHAAERDAASRETEARNAEEAARVRAEAERAEDRRLAEEARLAAEMDAVADAPQLEKSTASRPLTDEDDDAAEREFLESIGQGSPSSTPPSTLAAPGESVAAGIKSPATLPGLRPSPSVGVSADEETRPATPALPAGDADEQTADPKPVLQRAPPSRPAATLPPPERVRIDSPPSKQSGKLSKKEKRQAKLSQPPTKGLSKSIKALAIQPDAPASGTALALRPHDLSEEKASARVVDIPLGKETTEQVLAWDQVKPSAGSPTGAKALPAHDPEKEAAVALAALEDSEFNMPKGGGTGRLVRVGLTLAAIAVIVAVIAHFGLREPPPPTQPASHRKAPPTTDWKAIDAKAALVVNTELLANKPDAGPKAARPRTSAPASRNPSGPDLTPEEQAAFLAVQTDDTHHPAPPALQGPKPLLKDDDFELNHVASTSDSVDPVVLSKKLDQIKPGISNCVTSALQRNPNLRVGKVTVTVTVAPSGIVSKVGYNKSSFGGSDLGVCITTRVKSMVLPAFQGESSDVEFPLAITHD